MVKHRKSRANKTGRNDGNHYAMMRKDILEHPAFRALSSHAKALYPYFRLHAYGDRNGRIHFSIRTVMEILNVSKNTANAALHDLQAKGFIVLTEYGLLGHEGNRSSPHYGLTEVAISPEKAPRALYMCWKDGQDLPLKLHPTNNPNGWNGKTHLKN